MSTIDEIMSELRVQFGYDPDYVASITGIYDTLIILHTQIQEHYEANTKEIGDSDLGMACLKIEPMLDKLKAEIESIFPSELNGDIKNVDVPED